jgi:hypothetical protein
MHRIHAVAATAGLAVVLSLALACGEEVRERDVAEIDEAREGEVAEIDEPEERDVAELDDTARPGARDARDVGRMDDDLELGERREAPGRALEAREPGRDVAREPGRDVAAGPGLASDEPSVGTPPRERSMGVAAGEPSLGTASEEPSLGTLPEERSTGTAPGEPSMGVAALGEAAVLVPATIVVTSGSDPTLRIRNTGAGERTLRVNGLGIQATLPSGEETRVRLPGLEEGTIYGVALRGEEGVSQEVGTLVVLPGRPSHELPAVSSPPPAGGSEPRAGSGSPSSGAQGGSGSGTQSGSGSGTPSGSHQGAQGATP